MENMGENVEKFPFRGKPVENAPSHPSKGEFRMTKKQKKVLYQIIAAVILIAILKLLPAFPTPVERHHNDLSRSQVWAPSRGFSR